MESNQLTRETDAGSPRRGQLGKRPPPGGSARTRRQEFIHRTEALRGLLRGDIKFHAIACGHHDRLAHTRRGQELRGHRRRFAFRDGQFFPQVDRRGVMTEPEAENLHRYKVPFCAMKFSPPSVSSSTLKRRHR